MADDKSASKTIGAPPPVAETPAGTTGFSVEQLQQIKMLLGNENSADAAKQREVDAIRRQHMADDKQRAALGSTRVVALTSFTVVGVDDDGAAQTRVVKAGDEFDFPRFDVPAYEGKVRLKALDADEADRRGVTITGS